MGFHDRLAKAWSTSGSMLCVGLDPDPASFPDPLDGAPDAIERFCTDDRRRHRRPGLRVQAAVRPLRLAARRAAARGGVPLHPRDVPRRRARARRQARRRRLDRRALRPRGVRPLRRRCRHGEPVPRHRRRGPVPRRRRRARAVPHEQPGQRRGPGPRRRRRAAVRARRDDGRHAVVASSARPGSSSAPRSRPSSRPPGRSSATCRSSCPASAPRAATWRRRCTAGLDGSRHRAAAQLLARRPLRVAVATTSPTPPAPSRVATRDAINAAAAG